MFYDRKEAGERLSSALKKYKKNKNTIILAVPRGGVEVAFEVAESLQLPLDIIISRKIRAPGNPEFAIGAVSDKGKVILNQETINGYKIVKEYINKEVKLQRNEIKRRLKEYRGIKKIESFKNKVIIIVDDGIATGFSIKAAISSIKEENPKKIILAVPVAPQDIILELKNEVDELIVIEKPQIFFAVGQFYEIFNQTTDKEVKKILKTVDKN